MISTTFAQQPYFIAAITRQHIFKITSECLQTMQSNHLTNLIFIKEKLSRKHTGEFVDIMFAMELQT